MVAGNTEQTMVSDGLFAGPRRLPYLAVDDQISFFSSNAALQFLFPVLDLSEDGQCNQLLEWESTRLTPAVSIVLNGKPAPDVKQALQALLQYLDALVKTNQYLLGTKLTAADISVWGTLYPIYYSKELKETYLNTYTNLIRWFEQLAASKAIQESVKQWAGSPSGPFAATAALGAPLLSTVQSPVGSPEEPAETGVSPEELETAKDCWINGQSYLQPPLPQEKVVLPVKGRKNVLITSALPYVNNVPHLGNIIGCVLSGDIFARYCRMCDYNTLYICGTDEYGTATETKALEEGVTPREICDKYFAIHNACYRWFDIGFDYFGRTSTPQQTECKVCGHPPVIKPSEQFFLELGQVFYVWFDAPIGYMSITQCLTSQYEKWWKPDKEHEVKLYQFMAKDNVPFHAIMFPATILGVNEGHQLVNHIYATEYLNYEEGKFSKSRGVGVFGTDAQDTGIPSDVWRFYLASIRPETADSSFSWIELVTR
ncbi:tRNA synthetases class I (M) domain-containing protein [Phthorimaea operculella]|nr:tRNA synthetases class I (M) domain-containing protein [Phthorimaea operculella]